MLPAGAVFTFDHFWDGDAHNAYGPTATPVIFSTVTIEGNGATLQWMDPAGPPRGNSRLFAVGRVDDPGFGVGAGNVVLRNVYVKGFHIKGGNGGSGGGGGLGAGGAIYVEGFLTVENSAFESNGAVGGNGASDSEKEAAEDCRATAATDVSVAAAAAAVRAAMAAKENAGWLCKVAGAVAGRFFPAEMPLAERAALAGFTVAGMAGMLGMTAIRRPVRRRWWWWW